MTQDITPPMDATEEPGKDTAAEWVSDAASQKRVADALAEVDASQAHYPTCALCGQRAVRLDRFGLCSKTSDPHKEWRAEARADEKAGVAR